MIEQKVDWKCEGCGKPISIPSYFFQWNCDILCRSCNAKEEEESGKKFGQDNIL